MGEQLGRLHAALVDRYTIERELGRGGMATVYLSRDLKHDRRVALKVLHSELATTLGPERFQREIKLAARLQHPHILTVLDSGEAAGQLWYTMPFVEGESLRERLAREGQLPLEAALQITKEVADALGYAHSQGVIHRDIKPENILLSQGHALVADFGVARALQSAVGERLTETGMAVGTPAYMSPEQATGERKLDARSDIYSLGCVLYEMLAGEPPYTGPSARAVIAKRFSEPVPHVRTVRENVPQGIEQAITKALAKAPADRYAKAAEFVEALAPTRQPRTRSDTDSMAAFRFLSRRPLFAALVVGFLLGASVLFAWRRTRGEGAVRAAGPDPRRVAVADFENRTGEARLDPVGKMARDWLTRGILATGLVEVSDPGVVASGIGGGGSTPRALAEATGAGTVVTGAFYRSGDSLRFEAAITDARLGQVLQALPPVVGPVADPVQALEPLRQRTMGGLAVLFDPRLTMWVNRATMPPTYDAYVEFVAGEDAYWANNGPDALRHFARVRALDSSFVAARAFEVYTLWGVNECARADSLGRPLEARQASLAPLDRGRLLRALLNCRGDREGALASAREQFAGDPKSDYLAHTVAYFAGYLADRPREALAVMQGRDPKRGWFAARPQWYLTDLAEPYHVLGNYRAELREAELGRRRAPRSLAPVWFQLRALAALGRLGEVRALLPELESLTPDFFDAGSVLVETSRELRTHGEPAAAREVAARAAEWYRRRVTAGADSIRAMRGLREALYNAESWAAAERVSEGLRARDSVNLDEWGWRGVIAARRGDTATALRVDSLIASRAWPFAQGQPAGWRADIAALLGRREQAVALLKQAFKEGYLVLEAHSAPDLEVLRGYAPFEALLKPKG